MSRESPVPHPLLVAALLLAVGCTESAGVPNPGRVTGAQGGTIERTLWVFGGENATERKRGVWSIDFDDMRWLRHPDMPIDRVGGRAIYDGTSAFLVVGGCVTDDCSPVVRFDLETETWTPLADGPGNRVGAGLAMSGDTLWLFGGTDLDTGIAYSDVWSYLGGWTAYGDATSISGMGRPIYGDTYAATTNNGVYTVSGGVVTSWASEVPQSIFAMLTTADIDCMWATDDDMYIWADGAVYDCPYLNTYCPTDDVVHRSSVPGTTCGGVDATAWTYGGGDVTVDGDVNNDLWRYHANAWEQQMNGGQATGSGS